MKNTKKWNFTPIIYVFLFCMIGSLIRDDLDIVDRIGLGLIGTVFIGIPFTIIRNLNI